jgi:hypothetical protein
MDYLPIQASSVPCERVFSSSSETDTKKRNRIAPVLMEALQIVKFLLKKERLNFTKGWAASQKEMEFQMSMDDSESDDERPFLDNGSLQGDSQVHDALLKAIAEYECDNIDDIATVYSP